jgi:hypothetical protein
MMGGKTMIRRRRQVVFRHSSWTRIDVDVGKVLAEQSLREKRTAKFAEAGTKGFGPRQGERFV